MGGAEAGSGEQQREHVRAENLNLPAAGRCVPARGARWAPEPGGAQTLLSGLRGPIPGLARALPPPSPRARVGGAC